MQWNGPRLAPFSGGKPNSIVVLLHGVAANGRDLLFLAHAWRELLPDTEFIAPDAPFACDYAPAGRQWFSLHDRTPEKLLAGLRDAAAILDGFFDELLVSRRLDDSSLALAGFSQGAATALYAGLHRKEIAGVAAFSGALPGAALLRRESLGRPPVLLLHGEADTVVPFPSMTLTRAALEALSVPVQAVARPGLGHAIDDVGIALAAEFFRYVLRPGPNKAS
ncbi:dienelactone hydrolase family protein [Methylocapsa sp. D3K7]|uniref:alpha/beta hydrolase n=1 Tax=Methylocapsa sp. D3K7 TaxID=3041435 RepID=UPI00244E78A2|nr:dienelactone hydrolase family protein [Methylocapsa sp. D3K7]WGJ13513.1 dienelactone hydrolase family protein [Methylocapsa sp. D3K7]